MKITNIIKSFIDVLLGNFFPHRRIPFSMYWIITERCSNNCRYCNYRHMKSIEQMRTEELFTEQIKKILREMTEAGCRKIQFTGGEPLLRDDIVEILKQAKDCGMYVGLSTSGVGLQRHPTIYKYIDMAFISLDGPREIHNQTRGGNFFDYAAEAIDFFKQHNVKIFTTAVLTRININSVDYLLDFAKNKNILTNFVLCNNEAEVNNIHIPLRKNIAHFLLTNEETKELLKYLKAKKMAGYPIGSTNAYFDYLLKWNDYSIRYKEQRHLGINCCAGKFFGFLLPDGSLYPCADLYWREKPQNVLGQGFRKAFLNLQKPQCRACLNACYVEQNLVYSLNWRSIWEWGMDKLKGRW